MKIVLATVVTLALYSLLLCDGDPKRALRLGGMLLLVGLLTVAVMAMWVWAIA